jgi:SAM-dependent methyltransferase
MRNRETWRPSKYVLDGGRLRASRDRRAVSAGSWLHADGIARAYDAHARPYLRGDLVDLGCGRVPFHILYGPLVTSDTTVDWSRSVHGDDHVDVACSLDEALPFPDASFDTALLSDVVEHLPRPGATMAEVARVLRPGGCVILNTPFLYPLHEEPWDYQRLTRHGLTRLVGDAGLEPEILVETGGGLDTVADTLAKMSTALPVAGAPLAMGIQRALGALSGLMARTGAGRRARALWPSGYLLIARKPPGAV